MWGGRGYAGRHPGAAWSAPTAAWLSLFALLSAVPAVFAAACRDTSQCTSFESCTDSALLHRTGHLCKVCMWCVCFWDSGGGVGWRGVCLGGCRDVLREGGGGGKGVRAHPLLVHNLLRSHASSTSCITLYEGVRLGDRRPACLRRPVPQLRPCLVCALHCVGLPVVQRPGAASQRHRVQRQPQVRTDSM
jgi:hypothetical protein